MWSAKQRRSDCFDWNKAVCKTKVSGYWIGTLLIYHCFLLSLEKRTKLSAIVSNGFVTQNPLRQKPKLYLIRTKSGHFCLSTFWDPGQKVASGFYHVGFLSQIFSKSCSRARYSGLPMAKSRPYFRSDRQKQIWTAK
jgi:hypothetical protein